MERSDGGSSGSLMSTRGCRNRCHKMIHNKQKRWNTEIFVHSPLQDDLLRGCMTFKKIHSKDFKGPSVKNKHTMGGRLGRLLLGSHADGSRKMCEV